MMAATLLLILPLGLVTAALTDLFEMKIPNAIPVLLLLGFAALAIVLGLPWRDVGLHLLAGLVVFWACFVFFAVNVMGGGDAKLMTAAAVWFGFNASLLEFLAQVAVFGGVLTVLILIIRSQSSHLLALGLRMPRSLLVEKKIPYGIAIALGGFCTISQSPLAIMVLDAAK
ncbi:prepilin peptidase [Rhizobium sp.]|jgi:prepilin peptidase CpaA|uniref:A24 family peptidase n=1 Tax=Rhizobium sp. TaxID=391 RepID=UPI000E7E9EE2|nr:peptidase [Rhizobium sp.]